MPSSTPRPSLWQFANPTRFLALTDRLMTPLWVLATLALVIGLGWGLLFTPPAELHGPGVKMLFVHVPTALIAINCWLVMLVGSAIWYIRRHHVSALIARSAAPIGAVMTFLALLTGAVWGQPAWGAWWVWGDPRLTSFLILFLFYLSYLALVNAMESSELADDLAAALCLIGSVFALLSRYANWFWEQGQHQGSSLSLDRSENVANAYWLPLVLTMAGFVLYFLALTLTRTRTAILTRRLRAMEDRA
ncbi:heme ABC transporter permease CcmC [Paracoccaceae bacterium GXU_MW_L88]